MPVINYYSHDTNICSDILRCIDVILTERKIPCISKWIQYKHCSGSRKCLAKPEENNMPKKLLEAFKIYIYFFYTNVLAALYKAILFFFKK